MYTLRPETWRMKVYEALLFFEQLLAWKARHRDARELQFATNHSLTQNSSDFVPLYNPTDRELSLHISTGVFWKTRHPFRRLANVHFQEKKTSRHATLPKRVCVQRVMLVIIGIRLSALVIKTKL